MAILTEHCIVVEDWEHADPNVGNTSLVVVNIGIVENPELAATILTLLKGVYAETPRYHIIGTIHEYDTVLEPPTPTRFINVQLGEFDYA